MRTIPHLILASGVAVVGLMTMQWWSTGAAERAPTEVAIIVAPATHVSVAGSSATAVFAGGCFWGVEAVFEHVRGVTSVVSGYAGGSVVNPGYDAVSSGRTGHAEAVRVVFDPAEVSYETLMQLFFTVAHDPTELNRQGPDVGTQYRSAIFAVDAEQQSAATAYIARITNARQYKRAIVTQVGPLETFYLAEAYHQDYLAGHMTEPYIVYNDLPKLDALKKQFPTLWSEKASK